MAVKITIDTERCKGCGLCVQVCPNNCIVISNHTSTIGYFTAEATNTNCSGCAMCAIICPETIIEITRDNSGEPAEPAQTGSLSDKGLTR